MHVVHAMEQTQGSNNTFTALCKCYKQHTEQATHAATIAASGGTLVVGKQNAWVEIVVVGVLLLVVV